MKKTNRKADPAFDRLGTLPPAASKRPATEYEDSMIGHLDDDGDVITPPDAVAIPA